MRHKSQALCWRSEHLHQAWALPAGGWHQDRKQWLDVLSPFKWLSPNGGPRWLCFVLFFSFTSKINSCKDWTQTPELHMSDWCSEKSQLVKALLCLHKLLSTFWNRAQVISQAASPHCLLTSTDLRSGTLLLAQGWAEAGPRRTAVVTTGRTWMTAAVPMKACFMSSHWPYWFPFSGSLNLLSLLCGSPFPPISAWPTSGLCSRVRFPEQASLTTFSSEGSTLCSP
jgi:hypothetical protein